VSGVNERFYEQAGPESAREYATAELRPVEAVIVERYAEPLSGSVLEIGVGGGRLTAHLAPLARELCGIDISPAMVEACRVRFPEARFEVADLADLSAFADGAFDALLAGYNVIDVLGHGERPATLRGWARVLRPGGLLIFSTHNLHSAESIPSPWRVPLSKRPQRLIMNALLTPRRVRNRRRLAPHEERGDGWAVLNDQAHDFGLLHHYSDPAAQEAELRAAGFELLECLDLAGEPIGPGGRAEECPELHYCARSSPRP